MKARCVRNLFEKIKFDIKSNRTGTNHLCT